MIYFICADQKEFSINSIAFSDEYKSRVIQVLERGLNTLSPPDHDLIKLLEDMKK